MVTKKHCYRLFKEAMPFAKVYVGSDSEKDDNFIIFIRNKAWQHTSVEEREKEVQEGVQIARSTIKKSVEWSRKTLDKVSFVLCE